MPLTLAILAAGLGRRFGGNKQLAEVGPTGETLLDYTLYDAEQAGFDRVVCIVRRELEDVCRGGARTALERSV
jgi:CTP:molybdopterin cytidylyltransferase MocA